MKHDFLTSNGVRLHYVTEGEGPLMLLLHGFPEFWYSWRHQISEFSQDHKVVAIDLRGYNESEKPQDVNAYAMTELVKDVEGVIRGLGYDRCTLVGHDWGGAIAWHFAYTYPELLERLVVLNLPHPAKFAAGLLTPQQLLRSWYIFLFQLPFLPEWLISAADYRILTEIFTRMAVDQTAFTPADLKAYRDAADKPGALTAMLNYYRAAMRPEFFSRNWGILQIPTLLIWGENDLALGTELTYGTEDYVEDLEICYIPDCSHWVQQERPQLVNQYMRKFMAGSASPQGGI